jgi:hypothetical protein
MPILLHSHENIPVLAKMVPPDPVPLRFFKRTNSSAPTLFKAGRSIQI